ncbi:MAG: exonuclease domain-containing protein [Microscillaceae bacterium]|jgi:inhibitor of KinA sporulation pathway (predicted exonuclease)|nr:exonuclease domain-containing protein [Microscillaceae bacterium]
MAKKLDKILVVDVESTCWEGKAPEGQVSEIIEVGISLVNVADKRIELKTGYLVKPIASEISDFCTELTGITPAMIAQEGIDFQEVCKIIRREFDAPSRLWVSWGDYDRKQFGRNCELRKVGYPFGDGHLNLKTWFSIKHQLSHELGMNGALDYLQIPLEGSHHRGIDDAYNIAKILLTVL